MCEAMWIVASFHSTSFPFIQIVPVPGKAMAMRSFWQSYNASLGNAQCQGDTAPGGSWQVVGRSSAYRLLPAATRGNCDAADARQSPQVETSNQQVGRTTTHELRATT